MAKLLGIATHSTSRGGITTHDYINVSKEYGLENDFQGQKNPNTQVTLLSLKSWQQACQEIGADIHWEERRANLLVDDLEFSDDMIGEQVQIGRVLLEITRETDPCQRMEALHPGLKEHLRPNWRGGARCKVLRAGTLYIDDKVTWLKRV